MLPIFTESKACTSNRHCRTCRDRDGGRAFRAGLAAAFTLPPDAPDFACPVDKPWGYDEPPPVPVLPARVPRPPDPERKSKRLAKLGPPLWREFHLWAMAGGPDRACWLAAFVLRVPCGECKVEWGRIVRELPSPADPAALFGWSVAVHNRVNVKLGKPEMSESEAKHFYCRRSTGGGGERTACT